MFQLLFGKFNVFFLFNNCSNNCNIVIRIHARKVQETQGKQITSFLDINRINFYFTFLSFLIGGVSLSFEIPKLNN